MIAVANILRLLLYAFSQPFGFQIYCQKYCQWNYTMIIVHSSLPIIPFYMKYGILVKLGGLLVVCVCFTLERVMSKVIVIDSYW